MSRNNDTGFVSLTIALLLTSMVLAAPVTAQPYHIAKVSMQGASAGAQYSLQIYNSSGYPVFYLSSIYPEVAASLPSGVHLFVATAWSYYSEPDWTYSYLFGYGVYNIQGDGSITINLAPPSQMPTRELRVSVLFPNGSAVEGASVYAYPVGGIWFPQEDTKSYDITGRDGIATLLVPEIPLIVSGYVTVPVPAPSGVTIIRVEIGGETIEIPVYYAQTVTFTNQTLIFTPLPSETQLTLHYQPSLCVAYQGGLGREVSVVPCRTSSGMEGTPSQQPWPPTATDPSTGMSETTQPQNSTAAPIPALSISQQKSAQMVGESANVPIFASAVIITTAGALLAAQSIKRTRKITPTP